MIAFTNTYLWYTTRATGIVALLLLTLVVALGALVSNRIGGTFVGRFELNELHRSVSMVAMLFLFMHILTTVVDSYVSTGIISAFVPMTSAYKTIPIAIGAVGFDLLLSVWISSLLKVRIKNESWRFIHWFSWLAYTSAIVHAYMAGTDTHDEAGLLVVAGSAGLVLNVALWRYFARPERAAGRTALSPLPRGKTIPQRTDSPPRSAPTVKPRRR